MIPKVKQWAYFNNTFIKPLTEVRAEIITLLQFDQEDYSKYYIKAVNNTEEIADNLHEIIYTKLINQFPLTYKNCHYNDLREFKRNNTIELFRLQHLQIKPKSEGIITATELEEHNLVEYFNYTVEDVEKYSQIYFMLCEIK